jgi:hypothetical protein
MRLLRVLATATILAALIPTTSSAQGGRQFKDAWFWGLRMGAVSYSSESTQNGGAPFVGADWLITRTYGGLYLSYDEAFFNTTGGFIDRDPDSTFVRKVSLHDQRRFTMAGMVFPWQTIVWHTYAGLGLQYQGVAAANMTSFVTNPLRLQIAQDSILARKAIFTPAFIGGVQYRAQPFSVFAQGMATPTQSSFFLYNTGSRAFNFSLELGVRYNVGTSIERQLP